jgi:hypothetical protein
MTENDNIDSKLIAIIGAISTVILILTVLLLQTLFYTMTDRQTARMQPPVEWPALAAYKMQQADKLEGGYRWVDQAKGIVTLPIDRAMSLVVADRKAGKPDALPKTDAPPGQPASGDAAKPAQPASDGAPKTDAAKPETPKTEPSPPTSTPEAPKAKEAKSEH